MVSSATVTRRSSPPSNRSRPCYRINGTPPTFPTAAVPPPIAGHTPPCEIPFAWVLPVPAANFFLPPTLYSAIRPAAAQAHFLSPILSLCNTLASQHPPSPSPARTTPKFARHSYALGHHGRRHELLCLGELQVPPIPQAGAKGLQITSPP